MIEIEKLNEIYIRIHAAVDVRREIEEHFSFRADGYQFMPAYKSGWWDGYVRLYKFKTSTIYAGLQTKVEEFLKTRNYEYVLREEFAAAEFSDHEALQFTKDIKLPEKYDIIDRDYQLSSFVSAVRDHRGLFVLPTASGKSLIIYLIWMWFRSKGLRSLLLVPTIGLVHQMYKDFEQYGGPIDEVHRIYGGQEKHPSENHSIIISVWNSIYKLDEEYFSQYNVVMGDEAHLFTATSLTSIMEKLPSCKYRVGFTGTLKDAKANELVLEGLFGKVHEPVTMKELQSRGILSNMLIKAIVLKHSKEVCQASKKLDFQQETDFLLDHVGRRRFVKNLALSLRGVTLVLFTRKEQHGYKIRDEIEEAGRKVYYIDGDVDGTIREDIRQEVLSLTDATVLASYGTFQLGVNIPNINNIIFASPYKSKIVVLQSLGRGLRVSETKERLTVYDIADDLRTGKHKNHSYKHLEERLSIYDEREQEVKIYRVDIK